MKRIHPLMSVTGNFGKYGGAHPTHATLIGAASKSHGQVHFRGVIRAPEAARAAINATSNDLRSEVRRRMDHGAEAYRDAHNRILLPRHPGTRRAPIELAGPPTSAYPDGQIREEGLEYHSRGGQIQGEHRPAPKAKAAPRYRIGGKTNMAAADMPPRRRIRGKAGVPEPTNQLGIDPRLQKHPLAVATPKRRAAPPSPTEDDVLAAMARDAGAEDPAAVMGAEELFGAMDDEVEMDVDELEENHIEPLMQMILDDTSQDPQALIDLLQEEQARDTQEMETQGYITRGGRRLTQAAAEHLKKFLAQQVRRAQRALDASRPSEDVD